MSSIPLDNEEKLAALFKAWESIQDIKSLNKKACQNLFEFFKNGQNVFDVLKTSSNLHRFCEKFNIVHHDDPLCIRMLLGRKVYQLKARLEEFDPVKVAELKARLQELQPVIAVDLKNPLQSADKNSKHSIRKYQKLKNSSDYNHFISLFKKIYANE
jgi:hypothetical protein